MRPYIANTDPNWFDFLEQIAGASTSEPHCVPEVNFWFPNAREPVIRSISAGTPVFFRRKSPDCAIAGVGYFASFQMLPLDDAWMAFGVGNGDPEERRFRTRIRAYRTKEDRGSADLDRPLACMALRAAEFWPRSKWIPWKEQQGFRKPIVTGKFEDDPTLISLLMAAIGDARTVWNDEFTPSFKLPEGDERNWRESARQVVREGQATFRLRLLDAYGHQCAITGEHTVPVLDAAHIIPYNGRASNHVQNGLVLTKEFHALFDRGYVTIDPSSLRVRISAKLREDFQNGRRYYPYDGQALATLPRIESLRPSIAALTWHNRHVFKAS